jgi:outer membrane biosynthesis protein TonB
MANASIRLCRKALLLALAISGYAYSATISVGQQSAAPQANPTQQSENAPPTDDASRVYSVGPGVTAPKVTYSVEPEFSNQERRRKMNTNTLVQLIVGLDGHGHDIHVVRSAAEKCSKKKDRDAALMLDQKAIEAVSKYRFEPAKFEGKPVPVRLKIEVNFQIY